MNKGGWRRADWRTLLAAPFQHSVGGGVGTCSARAPSMPTLLWLRLRERSWLGGRKALARATTPSGSMPFQARPSFVKEADRAMPSARYWHPGPGPGAAAQSGGIVVRSVVVVGGGALTPPHLDGEWEAESATLRWILYVSLLSIIINYNHAIILLFLSLLFNKAPNAVPSRTFSKG